MSAGLSCAAAFRSTRRGRGFVRIRRRNSDRRRRKEFASCLPSKEASVKLAKITLLLIGTSLGACLNAAVVDQFHCKLLYTTDGKTQFRTEADLAAVRLPTTIAGHPEMTAT